MQKPEGRKYDKLFFLDCATLDNLQGILQTCMVFIDTENMDITFRVKCMVPKTALNLRADSK